MSKKNEANLVTSEPRRPRGWRRAYKFLATLLVIAAIAAVALHFSLPGIVRWQVKDVLTKLGYPDAQFTVERATLFGARIGNVRAGKNGELTLSAARIRYSPIAAVAGRIEAVRIDDANILVDIDALTASKQSPDGAKPAEFDPFATTSNAGLPVNRFDLRNCNFTIARGAARAVVRLDGVCWRETWDGDRARVSIQLRNAQNGYVTIDGTVDYRQRTAQFSTVTRDLELADLLPFTSGLSSSYLSDARGRTNIILNYWYADGKRQTDGSLELHGGKLVAPDNLGVTLDGIDLFIAMKSFEAFRAIEGQKIDVARITVDHDPPIELTNLHILFGLPQPGVVIANEVSADWATGRVRAMEPVTIDPARKSGSVRLAVEHVDIAPFLALVTGGQFSGEGNVSGVLPVTVEWPRVTLGSGRFSADAPGVLHFRQGVEPLAQSIVKGQPALRGQEGKIIEALGNFRYDELWFDFERTSEGLVVNARIAGRGKSGFTTPFELTFHFKGVEEGLNAYLAARSGVRLSGN